MEAGRKKLETFKARKSLLKQQQQQQQKEKEKKEEGETTIQTTTTTPPKQDEIFEQQQQQQEFHTPNALVSSSSSTIYDDSKTKTKATTTMVMQDEIEKIVREAVEKESAKLKRKFEEDVDELKQKHEEAREETEKEKKEFEDLKMEEMRKRMEEEKENFQTQSTERINELQEKVQKAVQKGKSMQTERDEIKSAFDALTTQSEELVKTIEIANERSGNAEKELGETKIQLQAKEKEFADLKSFYEENNASNLNEEERLKMELTETNAKMEEMTRKVDDAENETETVKSELRTKREEFDDLKQLFDDTAANATRGEEGLKEEIVALREQTNALKEELTTAAQTSEEKAKMLERELENEVSTRMSLETEVEELRHANAQSTDSLRAEFERAKEENEAIKLKCEAFEREINEELKPKCEELEREINQELKPKCDHFEQELSVAQEEISGQFQLGVERDEAQRKLAEAEQALEVMRKERDDLENSSSAAHEEALGKLQKELGEATIALRAKEKEFADLKSFYEENNASNLNEEERLKMELNEANANMQLVREEVETLKKKLTEQDEHSLAAANEQHSEQIQLLQATIAEARDEGNRERVVAESLKQELDAKVSEVQKMKIEIEHSAEKLEEINAEKEMFMSECEKALESFDREKAKAKELKQKLKDFDHESETSAQMKMEEHENALRAASERATFLEEELSKANAALTQASENVQRGPSAEELEREKQEQQRELHELKSRLDQELQGMNVLREHLQEERGKRAQLDARLAASLAAQQQQQATTTQHTGASEQKQPSPHHRFTNKKNEDYGDDDDETMLNDIEGAIISGGSYSFVPLQGKFKSLTFCPPLQSSGCLQAANMFDRFSVFLQRRPTLRVLLIGYFALLHVLLFLF